MAITNQERIRMRKAHSIGPKMLDYLAEIGVERLEDLAGADPAVLAMRIDVALGRRHMNRMGVTALANLVGLANAEAGRKSDR